MLYEMRAWIDEHGHTVRAMLPEGCALARRCRTLGYGFDPEALK
jgi:hypothetical protein